MTHFRFFHNVVHPLFAFVEAEVFPVNSAKITKVATDGVLRYQSSLSNLEFVGADFKRIVHAVGLINASMPAETYKSYDIRAFRHTIRIEGPGGPIIGDFSMNDARVNTRDGRVIVNLILSTEDKELKMGMDTELEVPYRHMIFENSKPIELYVKLFSDVEKVAGVRMCDAIKVLLQAIAPNLTYRSTFFEEDNLPEGFLPYQTSIELPKKIVLLDLGDIIDWAYGSTTATHIKLSMNKLMQQLEASYNTFWFVQNGEFRVEHISLRYRAKRGRFAPLSLEGVMGERDFTYTYKVPVGVRWKKTNYSYDGVIPGKTPKLQEVSAKHHINLVTENDYREFLFDWVTDPEVNIEAIEAPESINRESIFMAAVDMTRIETATRVNYLCDIVDGQNLDYRTLIPNYFRHYMHAPYIVDSIAWLPEHVPGIGTFWDTIPPLNIQFGVTKSSMDVNISHFLPFELTDPPLQLISQTANYTLFEGHELMETFAGNTGEALHFGAINKVEIDLRTGNCELELIFQPYDPVGDFIYSNWS